MPRRVLTLAALSLLACSSLPVVGRRIDERWAFIASSDARSSASARAHADALDAVVADWIALDTISGLPLAPSPDSLLSSLPIGLRRMAQLTSFVGERAHPEVVRRLAMDSLALRTSAAAIADRVVRGGSQGLVIDLAGLTARDTALTRAVVAAIAHTARARGVATVVVALPAADTAAYAARLFASSADLLLVMLYDQHWSTSPPGPAAAPEWVRRSLGVRVAEIGATRLVAALPVHGYVWRRNRPGATPISYDEGRRLAAEAGVALDRDPATSTLHAVRAGADGWELWVSDAVLVKALQREVEALNVRRVAWWRLGLEDPEMWK